METVEIKTTPPRIERLRDDVMARGGSHIAHNPFLSTVAFWRANTPTESPAPVLANKSGWSRVQIRANYLVELIRLAPVEIEPEWQIAGNHLPQDYPRLPLPDPDDPNHTAHMAALGITPAELPSICEVVARWRSPLWQAIGSFPEAYQAGVMGTGDTSGVYWAHGWMENHSIRDYAKVLAVGFAGIRTEIETCLSTADIADPEYPQKENFWRAALAVCEAGILLGHRYAETARELARTANSSQEVHRLLDIAERCDRVPAHSARTFAEAVQALWLAHILTCGEDGVNANSIGRLDQILYPYYEADRDAGRLSANDARHLMEELACRLYRDYDVQAITLGGVDRWGRDAVNELSGIILEATRSVGFVRDVSIRVGPDTPSEFIGLASDLIARGGGIPFIFNDDVFIPALTDRGIALEDARDYAPIGCVELTIPGRANPHAVSGILCSTKCLEYALFDGRDPRTGEQVGPQTGALASFATFDALYDAYCRQVDFFARRMVYHVNRGELAQREAGPQPCWSTLTDDCIARGRDITDGGAIYDYHSVCFIGTATTADSLMTLKRLLFEQKAIDAGELLAAIAADYEGFEPLRRRLLSVSKYGNDDPEVDALAARVDDDFIALMDGMRSPLGGRYFVHLFSFVWHLDFGHNVGATPDGRRAGEPLAYSLSAQQGRDVKGITALLSSLARLPHTKAAGGSAAIVEIDPVLVEGPAGPNLVAQLITTAMGMGVGQLQWNVVTAERLRQAQADPEHYGNIAVRVAGYSQMFRLIPKDLQDHIIARTKHRK